MAEDKKIEKTIDQKLFDVQQEMKSINKSKRGAFGNYAPLEDVWAEVKPLLEKHKLLCRHRIHETNLVTYILDTESTMYVDSYFPIIATEPQKVGAAVSYGKRYNIGCLLNIITDEDTDASKPGKTTGAAKATQGPNVQRVKDLLKEKHGVKTPADFKKKTKELLGIERIRGTYNEEMAKIDLSVLLK